MLTRVLLVAVGGGLGSVARYLLDGAVYRFAPLTFPYGTFVVNVLGCLVFGALVGLAEDRLAVGTISLPTEGKLLRIFVGDADRWHGRPLYEAIVEEAKTRGLAGATVWKGSMGFGKHSRLHTAKVLRLSEDLPVVIEIVDTAEKIEAFLPDLDRMVTEGLVTIERAEVILYRGPDTPR